MTLRFATDDEISNWNTLILANPDGGNVLQSSEIAELKTMGGWRPRYIITDTIPMVALERSVFGLGKFWYVIKGPGVTSISELEVFLSDLKAFAAKKGIFFIKIEPEIIKTNETEAALAHLGFIKARNIQPSASTILLDLSGSIDEIMASLNQKGRHALKRAERDGATVKQVPVTDENSRLMFDLYSSTAEGKYTARTYGYCKKFWQTLERAGMGQLFFAYFDGQLVAVAYALIFGTKSTYKDGGSSSERPVYGVSHLLQWHVIQWAKKKGAIVHDFCGTPPSDQMNNTDHPFYGFGRFKAGFSKEIVDFVGVYDIVIRPYRYRIWAKIGERIVLRWHLKRYHEGYY